MRSDRSRFRRDLLLVFVLGAAAVATAELLGSGDVESEQRTLGASTVMLAGIESISEHRRVHGPAIDPATDINGTGLIGAQFSSMTTTVGDLEAKRTTANPNMAGLMVHLLNEAGVQDGGFIAVGASGSFPGLILAILCAAQAMNVDVGLIVSLGASQWGANRLDFTWLDIEDVLHGNGILPYRAVAATIGGDLDVGRDLSAEARTVLRGRIEDSGAKLIEDPELVSNVVTRVAIYHAAADDRAIDAFVNIGGAWANLGTDASVLTLVPGVNRIETLPPSGSRGVIHAMAADDVPIIHLLNIASLALRFALPWDPAPLPKPISFRVVATGRPQVGVAAAAVYLGVVTVWLLWIRIGRCRLLPGGLRSRCRPAWRWLHRRRRLPGG